MGKLLRWDKPSADFAYTFTEVWRSNDGGVTFTQCTVADILSYTANGIALATPFANDINGIAGSEYKIRFYDNVNNKWSAFSVIMTSDNFRGYCTVEDVRSFSNVQSLEYDDGPIQLIIDTVTSEIDTKTGRTWQGIQVVTNELYDTIPGAGVGQGVDDTGAGSGWGAGKALQLNHSDIVSLDAMSVDVNVTGNYVVVTPAFVINYAARGLLVLDTLRNPTIEVSAFPYGRQTVKVSYHWGNAAPTSEIRYLAILMVLNQLYLDAIRYNKAQSILRTMSRRLYKAV